MIHVAVEIHSPLFYTVPEYFHPEEDWGQPSLQTQEYSEEAHTNFVHSSSPKIRDNKFQFDVEKFCFGSSAYFEFLFIPYILKGAFAFI